MIFNRQFPHAPKTIPSPCDGVNTKQSTDRVIEGSHKNKFAVVFKWSTGWNEFSDQGRGTYRDCMKLVLCEITNPWAEPGYHQSPENYRIVDTTSGEIVWPRMKTKG